MSYTPAESPTSPAPTPASTPEPTPTPTPAPAGAPTPTPAGAPTPEPARPFSVKKRTKRGPRAKTSTKRLFLIALRDVLITLALFIILLQFFTPTVVREHSMEDTLKENEILYISRKAYWFGAPQYGDIVVFHTALTDESGSEKSLVKRIIGLPGDHISISGGMVIRNNVPLNEPYLKSGQTPGNLDELVVPEDSYFVMGDNREVSNDSRSATVGFVNEEQLRGKVLFRIFPLGEFRVF
jgi:signal peptidase I